MKPNIFARSDKNPILSPIKNNPWQSTMVYNPGAIFDNEKYYLLYRAVGKAWVSKIGLATSPDGESFARKKTPIIEGELRIEKNGVEDPRIVKIKNTFYMTYTAYDGQSARLCLATSPDLQSWEKHGEALENWDPEKADYFEIKWDRAQHNKVARKCWCKAGAIINEKINDRFHMLFGDRNIWLASSKNGIKWQAGLKPFIKPRPGYFDSSHVEMGPPPIKTKKGWLVLYHGIDEKIVYRLGVILLDLHNPQKILYRSGQPIFEPIMPYEISGLVDILPGGFAAMETMSQAELEQYIQKAKDDHTMPSVIFCCGAILHDEILRIYYGAGDDVICTAKTNINIILDLTK